MTTKLKSYVEEFKFESGPLVVYTIGCPMGIADGEKLFNKLNGKIHTPVVVVLVCNVVEWHTMLSRRRIKELKDKHPQHKVIITGCINKVLAEKFKNLGVILEKKDMWDINNYLN